MPWLQKYVVSAFKVYAAVTTFSAIFFLCNKNSDRTLDSVLFREDGYQAIVFIHFCILLTALTLHASGRLVFGRVLVREWSNGGLTEELNSWICYRLVFLLGVLDIRSMRPFFWWCWWFIIILYLRFYLLVSLKRLKLLQTQENVDLHVYNKRIYRVAFFCALLTFFSFVAIWVSISTAFGDLNNEYLFKTLTNLDLENTGKILDDPFITQRKRPSRILRIFQNAKFLINQIFDLMGIEDHKPAVGPRMDKFLTKKIESKLDKNIQQNFRALSEKFHDSTNAFDENSIDPSDEENFRDIKQRQFGDNAAHEIIGLIQAIFFTLGDTCQLFIESCHMFSKHCLFILDEKFGMERRRTFYLTHWCTYLYEQSYYLTCCFHSMHLLYCVNFVSIPALIWFYQLRTHWHQLLSSRARHRRFIFMRRKMKTSYQCLSLEQIRSDDSCPICWESYDKTCRILPCKHIFHIHCIQQWFEQESTCPTCRYNLQLDMRIGAERDGSDFESNGTGSGSNSEDEVQLLSDDSDIDNGHFNANFFGMRFGISYQFGGNSHNLRRRRGVATQNINDNRPRQPGNQQFPSRTEAIDALADWIENPQVEQNNTEDEINLPETVQNAANNLVNVLLGADTDSDTESVADNAVRTSVNHDAFNDDEPLEELVNEASIEKVRAILPHLSRDEISFVLRRNNGSVTNSMVSDSKLIIE